MPLRPPVEIADLEERRCALAISEIARESEPWCGGTMNFEEPGSWASFALGMDFGHEFSAEDMDRLIEFYRSREAEPKIGVTPFHHESLLVRAAERGFTLREFECVFACDLGPRAFLAASSPRVDGLSIEVVDESDEASVHEFALVATHGFLQEGEPEDTHVDLAVKGARHPRSLNFLARIGGEAVAAGAMELASQLVTLYGVSTREPFRRRGIQRALIDRRLEEGSRRGATVATISSKPGAATERNALRAGFAPSYTHADLALSGETS